MKRQDINTINKIKDILLTEWGPLNIGQNPNLSDEYDDYILIILKALIKGIGINELSALLYKIELEEIGLNGYLTRCYQTAKALKEINF